MRLPLVRALHTTLLVFALATSPLGAIAASAEDSKAVNGLRFYLGILPSEMVLGHPREHDEGAMHGGVAAQRGQYHIVVALFDARTGARVSDARVTVRVTPPGMAGEEKALQPMQIGETPSYGNYFAMPGKGRYRIVVRAERPNSTGYTEAVFERNEPVFKGLH